MNESDLWLQAIWPAPAHVRAGITLRTGGNSHGRYASLNLGAHVGDDEDDVVRNRAIITSALSLKHAPCWLNQTHGTQVNHAVTGQAVVEADASWTDQIATVCTVLTADCLPVLLCDTRGRYVAAVHAGWRGLLAGIIEQTVASLPVSGDDILAWLGPAIGPQQFEVGDDVYDLFLREDPAAQQAFKPYRAQHWLADIYALARQRLLRVGVTQVFGGQWCTYRQSELFFSYRRDGVTGRMAAMIWMQT